jgi:hypothetical protein
MLCRALPHSDAICRTLPHSAAFCRTLPSQQAPDCGCYLPCLSLCNSSSHALHALCCLIAALPNMRLTVVVTCLASRSVTALRKLCRALPHSAAFHRTLPSQQAPDCGCYLPCLSLCNSSLHALSRSAALCRILRFLPHSAALCRICSSVSVMLPLLCVHCIAMWDVSFSAVFW